MIQLPVNIDHVGIFSNVFHPAEAMFRLGFSGETGTKILPIEKDGRPVRCMRFMLDNCYLECARNRDPEKYGRATHGFNYFEFASTDIVKTRDDAAAKGFDTTDLVHATRYADHGKKKGTAVFDCVALKNDITPNIETEFVCHATRELFYDNDRYIHENGIYGADEIILCCEEERAQEAVADLKKLDLELGDWGDSRGIRTMTFLTRDEMLATYGIAAPADCRNTGGVRLKTADLDYTARYLISRGVIISTTEAGIVIDLVGQQNIFFVITE